MSDPLYPYSHGALPGGDGAPPPPRYSDLEVDLIAARYTGTPPPPYPSSSTDVSAFDSHVGAFDSGVGAFDSHVGAFGSGVGAFDSHVGAFDSGVGPFDSRIGAFDSRVGAFDPRFGARRSAEALYHQSFMGSHTTVGQNEALYSQNTMAKRPKLESSLPIYPQRPGEKDCAFYMRTRTCKFGEACKFDHPQWVPEGGVPDWKEIPNVEDFYPERPGEPDCPYLAKSNTCRFKSKCKFNHPKEKVKALEAGTDNEFYAKTRKCKFGANHKFNHPMPSVIAKETIYTATIDAADDLVPAKTRASTGPTEAHNPKGLPIRPGEVDCSFYMKTGSCKFGSICRYNHPYRPVVDIALMAPLVETTLPPALMAPLVQTTLPPAPIVSAALLNPLQSFDFHVPHVPIEPVPIYPQRPGETVCDFYMKTGFCKYSEKCKFHHPMNRSEPDAKGNWDPEHPVTLTLAGLPRREGAEACAFYMRSGTCRYGPHCKFDHPPPQEAISKLQAAGNGDEEKKKGEAKEGLSVAP